MKDTKKYRPNIEKIRNAEDEQEKNLIERLEFVKFWANYVKTHNDKVWSRQQNIVINAQVN
jgi:hypothetical protein